jgi:hypothetical protein
MNTENILAVADAIEQHTIPWLGFNMTGYKTTGPDMTGHNCGTSACIAGWANAIRLRLSQNTHIVNGWCEHDEAANWLGIEAYSGFGYDSTADQLFYARNHPDYGNGAEACWSTIPAAQAVRTLRHLAATGNVDWTV